MIDGLVTVVLPIYNVERYLERSIRSVIEQTYTELEIILVDDGSKDHCPQMCDEWAEKDCRIKVIHKENAGLGMARNTGIENAAGEYIYFLDSDDYIAQDTIEKCYAHAKKSDADIVTFGLCRVSSDGEIEKPILPKSDKLIYEGNEVQTMFLPDLIAPDTATGKASNLTMSAWASFYSMKLIQDSHWRFVSEREIISEDYFSLLCLYKGVRKVAVLPEALYYYCMNASSLSHTLREDRYEKIKYFYDICIETCGRLGYSDEVQNRIAYLYFSNTIGALKMIAAADVGNKRKKITMNEILRDKHLMQVLWKSDIKKEKTARKLFLYSVKYKLFFLSRLFVRLQVRKKPA